MNALMHASPHGTSRASQGFTLIELVVVIVLIGILSAVAVPRFASFTTDARINSVLANSSNFQSAVNMAHSLWVISGAPASTSTVTMGSSTVHLNASGWPDPTAVGYSDAGAFWNSLMSQSYPNSWTAPSSLSSTMNYLLATQCQFSYNSSNGNVTTITTSC